jgi:transcriptional regulator with GAF, ATPase, and Fis domain
MRFSGDEIIGAEYGLKEIMEMVRKVSPLDSPVTLLGETGVGKEVIANAIHATSSRNDGPLVTVNCGAIPENLLDSELFGHEKGAFTGAIAQKRGHFERADGGTIFLDEIGELPPPAQVRLLRVLQHKKIERVGGTKTISVDVRIIAATHRDLEGLVKIGAFREDLWFRINVFPIVIPPLRDRKEDIPALVHHFIEKKSKELKIYPSPSVPIEEIDHLKAYHWPGNVRELENLVERELIHNRGKGSTGRLQFEHLELSNKTGLVERPDDGELLTLDQAMSRHILQALKVSHGRINGPTGAARLLGINPNTLRNRMIKLGIPYKHS